MTNFDTKTYTITETAAKLELSEKTLRRWEDAGRFSPSRTVGNQRRYSMEDLQILDAIKHNVIPHQKDLLTGSAAAQFLGVTEPTLDRLVAEGKLHPFITVGTTYFPRHRLLPLLEEFKAKTPIVSPPMSLPTPVATTIAPPTPTPNPNLLTVSKPPSRIPYTTYFIQILITLTLLTTYHLLFNQKSSPNPGPTNPANVQGAATNPSLRLLDDMLDPSTGGLTATTVISKLGTTTPNLTLLPGVAPTSPLAGSLYYDSSENTLKIYTTNGWQAIITSEQLKALQFDLESKVATKSSAK